jgi:hypothetical protein
LRVFLNMGFHGEALLAPRPTPKLEDHRSSAVRDCLFNLFAATLHIRGRSSIRNLRMRHAVVTGAHLTWCDDSLVPVNDRDFPTRKELRARYEVRWRIFASERHRHDD